MDGGGTHGRRLPSLGLSDSREQFSTMVDAGIGDKAKTVEALEREVSDADARLAEMDRKIADARRKLAEREEQSSSTL
ncbi:hypothetical protein PYCC9005_004317 [Savitreella phatthalungensis]